MKVIAVFDIENDRIFDYSCDLHVWNEFGDVRLVKENVPLKPLPEKKDIRQIEVFYGDEQATASVGWNACIDEILGDSK